MPWARLDDTFHRHTRVQDALDDPLGAAAIGLWSLALSWSYDPAGGKSSPLIPERQVRRLVGAQVPAGDLAALLVQVGLWEQADGGYLIHDWHDYRAPMLTDEARRLGGQSRAATGERGPDGRLLHTGGKPVGKSSRTQQNQQPPGRHLDQQQSSSPGTTRPEPIPDNNPKVPSGTSRGREAWTVACPACGAKAGEPCPRVRGGDRRAVHQERLDALHRPDYLASKAWNPFLDAWHLRFRLPPTRAQAEALWEAVDAYPAASASFVLDCPPGARARDVIASVLDRFHAVRGDAYQAAAQAEVQADAQRRAEALPRRNGQGPVPVAAVLDDLPM